MKNTNVFLTILAVIIAGYLLTSCSGKGKGSASTTDTSATKAKTDTLKPSAEAVPTSLSVTGSSVNMRVLPSVKAARIKQLKMNDSCAVLERGKMDTVGGFVDYWYKIKYKTKEGWVFGQYTSLKQQPNKQAKPNIFFQKKK